MYKIIEFTRKVSADVALPGESRLERVTIKKGTRVRAVIKPYVVESEDGPVETADLFLEDGSSTRAVPYASFRFPDE